MDELCPTFCGNGVDLMTQTIYIDILFAVNLFVNYFLLRATSLAAKRVTKPSRTVMGSILGTVYSVVIFFPSIPFVLLLFLKLLFAASIVAVTYGIGTWKAFLKMTFLFFTVNFLFAGIMLGIWMFFPPSGMMVNNSVVYFNLSPVILVTTTIAAYLLIKIYDFITRKNKITRQFYTVSIYYQENKITAKGFVDTGNTLTDFITSTPVIICYYGAIAPLLPENIRELLRDHSPPGSDSPYETILQQGNFRLIPCGHIGGGSLLPAFRPDKIVLTAGETSHTIEDVLVGIVQEPFDAGTYDVLLNPLLTSTK